MHSASCLLKRQETKLNCFFRSRPREICASNGGQSNLPVSIHDLQSTFSNVFDACSRFCISESRREFVSSSWHGPYLGRGYLHLWFQDVCCNRWPRDWWQLYHRLVGLSRSAVWCPAWTSKIWTFYNWNKMQPSGFLTGITTDFQCCIAVLSVQTKRRWFLQCHHFTYVQKCT